MPATPKMPISGPVLAWAMDEAGYSVESLAARMRVDPDDVQAWIDGEGHLPLPAFRKLARTVRRPSAILLLPEPPPAPSVAAAYRRAPGTGDADILTPQQAEAMRLAQRRQAAASELLQQAGAEPPGIPRSTEDDPADEAAERLRAWVGVDAAEQTRWSSTSVALAEWRAAFEDKGLLVFLLALGRDGIRGFSLWDDHAPLIASNTTGYNETARIFTLWHELGHLSRRGNGVCGRYFFDQGPRIERWCESLAAAALLPRHEILYFLSSEFGIMRTEPAAGAVHARAVAVRYKVSLTATAIRLIDLGVAPRTLYRVFAGQDRGRRGGGGGGETTPEKRVRELGERFASVVVDAWAEGRVPTHDALDYLDVRTTDLSRVEQILAGDTRT